MLIFLGLEILDERRTDESFTICPILLSRDWLQCLCVNLRANFTALYHIPILYDVFAICVLYIFNV